MITKDLDSLPIWNNELRLPLVTDDSELFELQILLGGIALVLSRLHPVAAKNRFTYTRGLAMKLSRCLESGDASQSRLTSAHLTQCMAECDRALDPGTLIVFKRLTVQTLAREQADMSALAFEQEPDSDFLTEENFTAAFARQVHQAGVGREAAATVLN
jgi:hypothetical protein